MAAPGGGPAQQQNDDVLCVICLDAPKQTLLLPCKHLCVCDSCAEESCQPGTKCPLCRNTVASIVSGVYS